MPTFNEEWEDADNIGSRKVEKRSAANVAATDVALKNEIAELCEKFRLESGSSTFSTNQRKKIHKLYLMREVNSTGVPWARSDFNILVDGRFEFSLIKHSWRVKKTGTWYYSDGIKEFCKSVLDDTLDYSRVKGAEYGKPYKYEE